MIKKITKDKDEEIIKTNKNIKSKIWKRKEKNLNAYDNYLSYLENEGKESEETDTILEEYEKRLKNMMKK